jgi:hypothetical protein
VTTLSPPKLESARRGAAARAAHAAVVAGRQTAGLFSTRWPPAALLRGLGALALLASLLARGIAPALPGSMTGIGLWIVLSDQAAAFLSQLFVVASSLLAVRLLVAAVREPRLGAAFRVGAVPTAAAVLTLVIAATKGPIDAQWTLGLGLVSALLAAGAAPLALRVAHTRAVGLVLGFAATAAVLQVCARLVALQASGQALPTLFGTARSLATAGLAVDVVVLALVGLWLAAGRWKWAALVAGPLLASCLTLSWAAVCGSHYQAPVWQVFASRIFAELTRHPTPWVPPLLRYAVDIATFATVVALLVSRRRDAAVHVAVALALLVRGATDIPVLALALALAALIAALASLSGATVRPGGEAGPQPVASRSAAAAPASSEASPQAHHSASAAAARPGPKGSA